MNELVRQFIPSNPVVTAQTDNGEITAVCLDAASERIMQQQRQFAYTVGGPSVAIAGLMLAEKRPLFGLFVAGLGVACTMWHHTAYTKVRELMGE